MRPVLPPPTSEKYVARSSNVGIHGKDEKRQLRLLCQCYGGVAAAEDVNNNVPPTNMVPVVLASALTTWE